MSTFGTLEFANSLLTYLLLFADAGLEVWGTREAAQTADVRGLVARVIPLRLLTASAVFLLMLAVLPLLPEDPILRVVLTLFGLSLFAQAVSLKWLFVGLQKMTRVAVGLVIAQIVFALAVFAAVHDPAGVLWVPIIKFLSDLALAVYFGWVFRREFAGGSAGFTLRGAWQTLRPALTIGASHAMGLLNYNFDSVLLGFLRGTSVVGWYSAAYKPVTVVLALPLTYFIGLFPVLAKLYAESRDSFCALVEKSFRLCAIFAVPLGVGGSFLAEPIVRLIFGADFGQSVLPFRILVWSAVFVILRGSFRHSLNAAGRQELDLRCAVTSASLNVGLNVVLIPFFGMLGAACATVFADIVWFGLAVYHFERSVRKVNPFPLLVRPVIAALLMGVLLYLTHSWFWMTRGGLAALFYFVALLLLGEPEVKSWLRTLAPHGK